MSEAQRSVTDPSAFKKASLGKQVLFFVVTLGLYGIYWYYSTNKQLSEGTDAEFNPTTRTILSIIPVVGLLFWWRTCNDCEAVTDQSGLVLFLVGIVFAPATWYLIQSGINSVAQQA